MVFTLFSACSYVNCLLLMSGNIILLYFFFRQHELFHFTWNTQISFKLWQIFIHNNNGESSIWNTIHCRPKCAYIFKCRWSFNFYYDVPTCQKATSTTTTTKSICLHYHSQGSHGKNIPSAIDYYDMKSRVLFHLMIYVCCN